MLQRLRRSAHPEPPSPRRYVPVVSAPVQVQISHTMMQYVDAPAFFYTVYIMQILSSNVLWVVRHRYSALASTRALLLKTVNMVPRKDYSSRAAVAALVEPLREFPRKYLFMDTPRVVNDRKKGLAMFVQAMFHVRDLCLGLVLSNGENTLLLVIAKGIIEKIETTLQIPVLQKEEDHKWRLQTLAMVPVEPPLNMADDGDRDGCSICLENLHDLGVSSVQLACSHAFHRGCVAEWLARQSTCPLCRASL
ncbi:hypothetical protein ACHHYP_11801 [Achlya hypogyna]|uniref:RING-type domain-containing protein n=1 Tax=Achlya hypogyna TaxID=1202772 RepID=A0A1V9YIF9_ACHHY|nr:hypothetical protein ACHHYP_11801 [Achlya hypogyna]